MGTMAFRTPRVNMVEWSAAGQLVGTAGPRRRRVHADLAPIPEMTGRRRHHLSTDANGGWLAEQSWSDVPLTQGTAGGLGLFGRPPGSSDRRRGSGTQRTAPPAARRRRGRRPVHRCRVCSAGRSSSAAASSQAARVGRAGGGDQPAAGLAGARAATRAISTPLYGVAKGSAVPGFRDIELGGNAVSPGNPATTW